MPTSQEILDCQRACLQEYRDCLKDNESAAMECTERFLIFCLHKELNKATKRRLDKECEDIYNKCKKACESEKSDLT